MPKPRVRLSRRSLVADITNCPSCGAALPREESATQWIESVLPLGWVVSYRIVRKDDHVVVGEARIHPRENNSDPGEWSRNPDSVPEGGLKTAVVRALKIGEPLRELPKVLDQMRSQFPGATARIERRHRFTNAVLTEPVRPGRRGRDPRSLAEIARSYVAACDRGSRSPVQDVVDELARQGRDKSPASVSTDIYNCRHHDPPLLTPAQPGRAGGRLTAEATRLLSEKGRKR